MCCEDVIDLIFEGFSRNYSRLNIDEDVAWNSLEVDVSYAGGLLERVVDRRVALCAGRACEHKRDPLFHCEGNAGETAR